jgi:hypothetical protein
VSGADQKIRELEQDIAILKGFLAETMARTKMFAAFLGPFEERAAKLMADGTLIPNEITGWKKFWEDQATKRGMR